MMRIPLNFYRRYWKMSKTIGMNLSVGQSSAASISGDERGDPDEASFIGFEQLLVSCMTMGVPLNSEKRAQL